MIISFDASVPISVKVAITMRFDMAKRCDR